MSNVIISLRREQCQIHLSIAEPMANNDEVNMDFMELVLKREMIFPDAIHGKIYYRNKPICCTLEKPNHCLEAGTYRMRLEKLNEEDEFLTPCLYRTHSEVFRVMCTITKGNGIRNLRSYTIFAGKYQCRGLVIRCEEYLKRLNEWIVTKRENEKEKIFLIIKDYAVN